MNREGVIIKKVAVTGPMQVKFFEVKIPREVEHIVGIEIGSRLIQGVPSPGGGNGAWKLPTVVKSNVVLGDLKLQSFEQANIFYSGEAVLSRNVDYADFTSRWFVPRLYTHQLQAHEEEIKVAGATTLIKGVFRDTLYTYGLFEYKYDVNIYIWTQSKEQTGGDAP